MQLLLACSEELARRHAADLGSEGWNVVVAHDVPTALMQAHRVGPDVVAVAARLPGGDGATLVSRLRHLAATSLTPVLGLADGADGQQALYEAGAQRCLDAEAAPGELAAAARTLTLRATADPGPAQAAPPSHAGGSPSPPAPATGALTGQDTLSGGGRVMVVEDDASVRGLLIQTLELEGYVVVGFEAAGRGLDAALARPPDVLLLDVMLPDMSGLELLRRLRESEAGSEVPVLLISALDDATVVEGLRQGAQDYIRKPFDIDEVLARVAAAVQAKQARDRLRGHVDELENRALSDRLTGLPNRRAAEQDLERFAAQTARLDGQLSLLALEVDDYEQLAADHGRDAADRMVVALASRLAATCRTADVLARWSERIFVVLLPWTGSEGAGQAAVRIRGAVAAAGIRRPDGAHASVTVGAATMRESTRQLLVDAEAALRSAAHAASSHTAG